MTGTKRSQIKRWIADYDRDFNGKCQALMYQVAAHFGSVKNVPPSAIAAYRASTIKGTDLDAAPAGAFVYWDIGVFGHVGLSLGDGRVFMGSSHVQRQWGTNAGVTTAAAYEKATGAVPLGWALDNGGNTIALAPPAKKHEGLAPVIYVVQKGDTLSSIAARHHTTWQAIFARNRHTIGDDPDIVRIGMRLRIR